LNIYRRQLLQGAAAAAVALPWAGLPSAAHAQAIGANRRILIKGGYVVSGDPSIGELSDADVLIDGSRIAAVGRNISVTDAVVIDAKSKLVLPGLIDTHRHTWQTQLRSMIPEGDFFVYLKVVLQTMAPRYRPEDVYVGNLVGAIGAINSGITTLLDWSHIMQTPAHADAAIKGLADSGIRGIFAYGYPIAPYADWSNPKSLLRHPADVRRVKQQYFSSQDQLLTLAMAIRGLSSSAFETTVDDLKLARELAIPVTVHTGAPGYKPPGAVTEMKNAGLLGPDITHVHTLRCSDDELKMIADSGGFVSSSPATELMSGQGYPSLQRWLKFGIKPALSIDNESRLPTDLFTQMRALVMVDHIMETQRVITAGGKPVLVPVRDVLEYATLQGARATGLEKKTGSLTPGKQADIILMDLDDINMFPVNDPVSSAVLIGNPGNVSWVFVDGKVMKREGKLVGVDLDRLRGLMATSHEFLTRGIDTKSGAVRG
jgi:5-methylthioadenosine/S-adenosylhomocysteine deaminase